MSIEIGDRVEITKYRDYDDDCNGWTGIVVQLDTDSIPYLVRTVEDGDVWAQEVRKLGVPAATSREALVTRAKELLAGTPHTVADIIAMANFLAGE